MQLGSVRFRSFFQFSELDLRTLDRYMKTQRHPHSQLYSPPTPISIYFLCQHTSKCMKRVRLNLFCVCVTFLALRIHEIATSLTFSAIGSSYPTFDLFPAPAHLQMQETSSFELVSCLHNIPSPTHTQRLDGAHTLCYTPLLRRFPSIPCINLLQMYKMSLFELISCLCNIPSPMDTQKLMGTHSLCHMHLLHPFPSIPCVNTPPNPRNEFV